MCWPAAYKFVNWWLYKMLQLFLMTYAIVSENVWNESLTELGPQKVVTILKETTFRGRKFTQKCLFVVLIERNFKFKIMWLHFLNR